MILWEFIEILKSIIHVVIHKFVIYLVKTNKIKVRKHILSLIKNYLFIIHFCHYISVINQLYLYKKFADFSIKVLPNSFQNKNVILHDELSVRENEWGDENEYNKNDIFQSNMAF